MSRRKLRTASPALAFALIGLTSTALADTSLNPAATASDPQTVQQNRNLIKDDQGFFTSLPAIDDLSLLDEIADVRQTLRQRQIRLSENLERNQFKPADAVIVALAPGGLLYAAYKTQRQQSLKNSLASLDKRIMDLDRELLALEGITGSFRIASLP